MSSLFSWLTKGSHDLLPAQTTFISLRQDDVFSKEYRSSLHSFKKAASEKGFHPKKILGEIRNYYKTSLSSIDAVTFAYNKEYGSAQPNYAYLSPILTHRGFKLITKLEAHDMPSLKVLDVGAGSNEFLRFCHNELNINKSNLHGSDISQASVDIINRDGFNGYRERLEKLPLPPHSFDLIFLSYFIDYDTDQASTFKSAVNLVQSGGKIVLEGKFPVRPFALLPSDKNSFEFITKGKNKFEDTILVFNYIQKYCLSYGFTAELESVSEGSRYVYSRYGFTKLPAWFLTIRINKKH